ARRGIRGPPARSPIRRRQRPPCSPGPCLEHPRRMRARLTVEAGECLPTTVDLLPGQPVTLGRSRDNTVVVRDELASRLHAKIYFEEGRWHLRDFGLNGTRVEGVRVNGAVELSDGKQIKIGDAVIRFNTEIKP